MENERSLAHVEIITNIQPIPGADKIEVATVLGWECIIKKGEFKIGEKVIYVEVDSVLPDVPEFEFLRDRKFRIRTINLLKQVSQGLVLPLSVLNKVSTDKVKLSSLRVGDDVTEKMKIVKYLTPSEREEMNQQSSKAHWTKNNVFTKWLWRYAWFRNLIRPIKSKGFPKNVAKTDELRVQAIKNFDKFMSDFGDKEVYVTEKIDYMSSTFTTEWLSRAKGYFGKIIRPKKVFVVCSRNYRTNDKNSLYWKIAKKLKIDELLLSNNLTIQGELGDMKVQGNKYGITEMKLWVFNVINHSIKYQFNYDEMKKFCDDNGLTTVPLVKKCKLSEIGTTVNDFVEFSKGKSVLANIPREGVVIRCIEDGKVIFSFKSINPDFLLAYKD